jgi:hypothetical protein
MNGERQLSAKAADEFQQGPNLVIGQIWVGRHGSATSNCSGTTSDHRSERLVRGRILPRWVCQIAHCCAKFSGGGPIAFSSPPVTDETTCLEDHFASLRR